jgi:hypothetical protein
MLDTSRCPSTHTAKSVTSSIQNSSTTSTVTIRKPANSSTFLSQNSCPTNLDPLKHAKSLEQFAIGLAYGFFDVTVFRCPIHREKLTIASQKPRSHSDENSSTDFTAQTCKPAKSITSSSQNSLTHLAARLGTPPIPVRY